LCVFSPHSGFLAWVDGNVEGFAGKCDDQLITHSIADQEIISTAKSELAQTSPAHFPVAKKMQDLAYQYCAILPDS